VKFYQLSTFQLRSGPDLVESAPYSWAAQHTRGPQHRQVWEQLSPLAWRLRDVTLAAIVTRYWNMQHEIQ
jgi:hypothetical protein